MDRVATTATRVIRAVYERTMARYGCPRIIADSATIFHSREFEKLLKCYGIMHCFTLPRIHLSPPCVKPRLNQNNDCSILRMQSLALNTARHESKGLHWRI